MKKTILLCLLTFLPLLVIGQTGFEFQEIKNFNYQSQNEIVKLSNKKIISDDIIVGQTIYVSDLTIDNNATVYIGAVDSVVLGEGFVVEPGAIVVIGAILNMDDFPEATTTSIENLEPESMIKSVKVYTITGQIIYSSETNTDIYSIGLSQGIYIIEKEYDNGSVVKEKVMLKN